ncbi:MAG: hypothetical protein AAFM92_08860 [Pseudomonadota bacterium]
MPLSPWFAPKKTQPATGVGTTEKRARAVLTRQEMETLFAQELGRNPLCAAA